MVLGLRAVSKQVSDPGSAFRIVEQHKACPDVPQAVN